MNETTRTISASELDALLASDAPPVLVDLMPEAVWQACRLPGAHNACVYEVGFAENVITLVPDRASPLVLYGAGETAHDADAAAAKLLRRGYDDVRILTGGLAAWHGEGRAVEGTHGAPPPSPSPPELGDGRWRIDPAASAIRWVGRNANGFHDGSVDLTGGDVAVAAGEATGTITIDPRTLRNFDLQDDSSQPVLVEHLLSDDFLFVARHPEVVFTLTGVREMPEASLTTPTHEVRGDLRLRGITAPLRFPATVTARPGGGLVAEAHFELDRTRWGILYGSARFFRHLGGHAVFDPVSVSIWLVLTPAAHRDPSARGG